MLCGHVYRCARVNGSERKRRERERERERHKTPLLGLALGEDGVEILSFFLKLGLGGSFTQPASEW